MSDSGRRGSARGKALDLLARREHTELELRGKLGARGFDKGDIEVAISGLKHERLLSDARFAEAFVHQRFNAGYGPLRIRHELRHKGIEDTLIDECLEPLSGLWRDAMLHLRRRKYGDAIPGDQRARAKQARFLQNRGFSAEAVMRLFDGR